MELFVHRSPPAADAAEEDVTGVEDTVEEPNKTTMEAVEVRQKRACV
jgi:hypothetical protein